MRVNPFRTELRLLSSFEFVCGGRLVTLPLSAQRLVASLALHERPLLRVRVAGSLWPETSDERAAASLRSTLWRIRRCGHPLVAVLGARIGLDRAVDVDLRRVEALARSVVAGGLSDVTDVELPVLAEDLLPDWYEDWVLVERERFRQLRLRALDALCGQLTAAGRFAEALDAGLAAVAAEPLRESAHRAVIGVHLAEGNRSEALRQRAVFRQLTRGQLRIEPSERLEALLGGSNDPAPGGGVGGRVGGVCPGQLSGTGSPRPSRP